MTLANHVLVTSFTINNKSTFVQRCLIGNLLSDFFNGFTISKLYGLYNTIEELHIF